jgi:hypothetical protein
MAKHIFPFLANPLLAPSLTFRYYRNVHCRILKRESERGNEGMRRMMMIVDGWRTRENSVISKELFLTPQ